MARTWCGLNEHLQWRSRSCFFHLILTQFRVTFFVKQRLICLLRFSTLNLRNIRWYYFSLHYFITFVLFLIKEQGFSCRGGLSWWREFLIVPCYNFTSSADEVGLHYPSQDTQALKHSFPLLQLCVLNRRVRFSFAYCPRRLWNSPSSR